MNGIQFAYPNCVKCFNCKNEFWTFDYRSNMKYDYQDLKKIPICDKCRPSFIKLVEEMNNQGYSNWISRSKLNGKYITRKDIFDWINLNISNANKFTQSRINNLSERYYVIVKHV